jgi:hypothetical protein
MNNTKSQNSTWCPISIGNDRVNAKVSHIGRGKFKVLEAEESGRDIQKHLN